MASESNGEIIKILLHSVLSVIARRSSSSYAVMVIGRHIRNLSDVYDFLNKVEINNFSVSTPIGNVDISVDSTEIQKDNVVSFINDFLKNLSESMGKEIGFYFIKEIKEELPSDFNSMLNDIGVNFDLIQMQHIQKIKNNSKDKIKNSELIRHVFSVLFDIFEIESNRNNAFSIMRELINRFDTEYDVLRYVSINDLRTINNAEIISIENDVENIESEKVAEAIQKILNEANIYLEKKGGNAFVEKIKQKTNEDYLYRLKKLGVDLESIPIQQNIVLRNVIRTLINVLGDSSSASYAILVIKKIINETISKFSFLDHVKINSDKKLEESDAIIVESQINGIRSSELGRGIQKLLENVIKNLGEQVGPKFIEKFKKDLGKAYLLRIEEMGVNLHLIQLRQNMIW